MISNERPRSAERFMPDWIVGGFIRLSLAPGLWFWGRDNAAVWPDVMPGTIEAAHIWDVPLIAPDHLAQLAVWGSQLVAVMLVLGFLTRIAGLALLAGCAVYATWIAPEAWPAAVIVAAMSFYLFARGGGAFSIDGAIAGTLR